MTPSDEHPAPSPRISTFLRYRDVGAALAFLEQALGFTRRAVQGRVDGTVIFATASFGDDLVLLSEAGERSDWDRLFVQPAQVQGRETQCPYLRVADAAAALARAEAAGAHIERPLHQEALGGECFTIRDPEAHVWNVGTFDPWSAVTRP